MSPSSRQSVAQDQDRQDLAPKVAAQPRGVSGRGEDLPTTRGTVFDAPAPWGLADGDRRFLGGSLALMVVLLSLHSWRQAARGQFDVEVLSAAAPLRPATPGPDLPAAAPLLPTPEQRPVAPFATAPRSAHFQVDMNQSDWVAWAQLDGIGETLARRIVADRAANGPFASVDEIMRVRGIGVKTLARIRPHLRLHVAAESPASVPSLSE